MPLPTCLPSPLSSGAQRAPPHLPPFPPVIRCPACPSPLASLPPCHQVRNEDLVLLTRRPVRSFTELLSRPPSVRCLALVTHAVTEPGSNGPVRNFHVSVGSG